MNSLLHADELISGLRRLPHPLPGERQQRPELSRDKSSSYGGSVKGSPQPYLPKFMRDIEEESDGELEREDRQGVISCHATPRYGSSKSAARYELI